MISFNDDKEWYDFKVKRDDKAIEAIRYFISIVEANKKYKTVNNRIFNRINNGTIASYSDGKIYLIIEGYIGNDEIYTNIYINGDFSPDNIIRLCLLSIDRILEYRKDY